MKGEDYQTPPSAPLHLQITPKHHWKPQNTLRHLKHIPLSPRNSLGHSVALFRQSERHLSWCHNLCLWFRLGCRQEVRNNVYGFMRLLPHTIALLVSHIAYIVQFWSSAKTLPLRQKEIYQMFKTKGVKKYIHYSRSNSCFQYKSLRRSNGQFQFLSTMGPNSIVMSHI